jgi:antimicrobial peptide system SdpB family protein
MRVINKFEKFVDNLSTQWRWTNAIGVARTVLAVGTLITLLFNNIYDLVEPLGARTGTSSFSGIAKISIYHLLDNNIVLAKWLSVAVLLLVASGWRPRITGILHWWIAFSFSSSAMVLDGGDQITATLTLLLIPICLVDSRKWHWSNESHPVDSISIKQKMAAIVATISLLVIKLQVAFIYFHAAVGKFEVEEWANGTAVYYWLNNPIFGASEELSPILNAIVTNPLGVTAITWGAMILELTIFLGLTMNRKWHPTLMKAGIAFHFTIIIFHGLVSFFCAMAAALILFLGAHHKGYKLSIPKLNWRFARKRHQSDVVLEPQLATASGLRESTAA